MKKLFAIVAVMGVLTFANNFFIVCLIFKIN